MSVTVLYRPVGQREYDLVAGSGFRRFPPRLPDQSFFEAVADEPSATRMARDWNTRDEASGWTGYVLRFHISSDFLRNYPTRGVASALEEEYWIPAAELDAFNAEIQGKIEVVACYRNAKRQA